MVGKERSHRLSMLSALEAVTVRKHRRVVDKWEM